MVGCSLFLVLGRVFWMGVIAVDVSLLDLNVCECVFLPVVIFGVEDYGYFGLCFGLVLLCVPCFSHVCVSAVNGV
jgi:hypothetical protein